MLGRWHKHPAPAVAAGFFGLSAASLAALPAGAKGLELAPGVELGGAVRVNILDKSWEKRENKPRETIEFDTIYGRLDAEHGPWSASTQYRYYHYSDPGRATSFFHHLWAGRDLGEMGKVEVGIAKVPFGILPVASNSYFFSLAYYIGYEDDYDLGATWQMEDGPWQVDVAYFPSDEWNGTGESVDSSRYSYDIVKTDTTHNTERHQVNLRAAYTLDHAGAGTTRLGVSGQYGRVRNVELGRGAPRMAGAVHMKGDYGPWGVKLEAIAYDVDPLDTAGTQSPAMTMGAYDYAYEVAAEGQLYSAAFSYRIDGPAFLYLEGVKFYNDFSVLDKNASDYNTSLHNVTGSELDFEGPLLAYLDFALGRNNAWIGPDFGTALAGGDDDDWNYRLNLNLGVYF